MTIKAASTLSTGEISFIRTQESITQILARLHAYQKPFTLPLKTHASKESAIPSLTVYAYSHTPYGKQFQQLFCGHNKYLFHVL